MTCGPVPDEMNRGVCAQLEGSDFPVSKSTASGSVDVTPRAQTSSHEGPAAFGSPRAVNWSEPRNYAPRTAGYAGSLEPPPKFDLDRGTSQSLHVAEGDPFDAKATGSSTWQNTALQLYEDGRFTRSEQLSILLNTALRVPSLATALDPSHFPFVESGKQCRLVSNGVVKLQNVSDNSGHLVVQILTESEDSLRCTPIRDCCPFW